MCKFASCFKCFYRLKCKDCIHPFILKSSLNNWCRWVFNRCLQKKVFTISKTIFYLPKLFKQLYLSKNWNWWFNSIRYKLTTVFIMNINHLSISPSLVVIHNSLFQTRDDSPHDFWRSITKNIFSFILKLIFISNFFKERLLSIFLRSIEYYFFPFIHI